jgi:hypothetical protein
MTWHITVSAQNAGATWTRRKNATVKRRKRRNRIFSGSICGWQQAQGSLCLRSGMWRRHMRKKVIANLCLVIGITVFAVAAWISYLNNASTVNVPVQDIKYQILYKEWWDCLKE